MTSIIWSPQAIDDLQAIREYISRDSENYAALVVHRLVEAVERLREFPESGRVVPELNKKEIREVIVPPYRIVYRLQGNGVEIVTVYHASRLLGTTQD